ncbi:sensor histidine kinase [Krasilnikoviella flava]|uniref:Sensor-like histidine kinase SenX3 n=1 Tax=Krasilnikoviella flava TaxID=526729 RepID=A0A1T5M2J3_9MICO|nr:ATP-binding protein [Krasilnikoviella flava]SKC82487.1 PAS fold-containing protein [Krasilnikoviella flava]
MSRDGGRRLRETYESVWTAWFADDAVGLRQLPLTVSFFVVLVILRVSGVEGNPPVLALAVLLVVAVQLVGSLGRWDRWPQAWRFVLPLVQMLAIGVLELGSGLILASFFALLFLPVVSLALQPGPWGLVVGLCGAVAALFVPKLLPLTAVERVHPVMHSLVVLLVLGLVAVGTHGIVGLVRRQAAQLGRARDDLAAGAQQLRASRDTLRGIMVAATEVGFLATDSAGRVGWASPGAVQVFGRPDRELVGLDVSQLVDAATLAVRLAEHPEPEAEGAANRVVLGTATAGDSHVDDWSVTLPDGERRHLEFTVTERPAPSGSEDELPAGYLVVVTDVTARHEEERIQDEFIGLVSHELRTPLASILGYVDLLRLGGDRLDDEQRGYLAVVERNARRLGSLVDDLLTSAQIAAGRPVLAGRDVDVAQVVREVVENSRPAAQAAGVEVVVDGDPVVPLVSDPDRLGHVVSNLVSNAVKYSSSGGLVRVTVTAGSTPVGSNLVRLQVADRGFGISADEIERVTQRFYRSRETRRRRVRGVGLGLALVDRLVHDHGGVMSIRSEPGDGTEVDVALPDLPGPGAPAAGDAQDVH